MSIGGFVAGLAVALLAGPRHPDHAAARGRELRRLLPDLAGAGRAAGLAARQQRRPAPRAVRLGAGGRRRGPDPDRRASPASRCWGSPLIYRPLVVECFDPLFLRAQGGGGGRYHLLFLVLVVLNLVASFQALGTLMAVGPDDGAGRRRPLLGRRGLDPGADQHRHRLRLGLPRPAGLVPSRPAVGPGHRADRERHLPALGPGRPARRRARARRAGAAISKREPHRRRNRSCIAVPVCWPPPSPWQPGCAGRVRRDAGADPRRDLDLDPGRHDPQRRRRACRDDRADRPRRRRPRLRAEPGRRQGAGRGRPRGRQRPGPGRLARPAGRCLGLSRARW